MPKPVETPQHEFEVFKTVNKQWCWRVNHINGNEICRASEPYKNKKDAVSAFLNFYQTKNIKFIVTPIKLKSK